MSEPTNDIDSLLRRIERYDLFGLKGHGDMLYRLANALEYLDAQAHSVQRAQARASIADMLDLVTPIGKTLSDARATILALVAERDALREQLRLANIDQFNTEAEANERDRDLRERLVCAIWPEIMRQWREYTGAIDPQYTIPIDPRGNARSDALIEADAMIAAMRKGEA